MWIFLYEEGFSLLKILQQLFNKKMVQILPELFNHFSDMSIIEPFYFDKWVLTLFTYNFHYGNIIRFWDYIFVNGVLSMVDVSVGILSVF